MIGMLNMVPHVCVCVFVFLQTGTLLFRRSSPSVNIKLHNKKHRFLIQYLSWFCASKSKEVTSTKTTQQIRTKNIRISILRKHVTLTNQPNINYINALLSGKLRWLAGKRTLKWKMYSLLKNADLQASHVSLPTQPSCTLIREFLQNYIHLYTRNICCLFDPPKYVAFNDTLCNHLFFFLSTFLPRNFVVVLFIFRYPFGVGDGGKAWWPANAKPTVSHVFSKIMGCKQNSSPPILQWFHEDFSWIYIYIHIYIYTRIYIYIYI